MAGPVPDRRGLFFGTLPERLTRAELAAFWRVTVRTIERREALGIGPRPIWVAGRVLYRREDVLAWEEASVRPAGASGDQRGETGDE